MPTVRSMSRENEQDDEKGDIFDFASFLATSARGSLEEGTMASSLRLVDALAKLPEIFPDLKERDIFVSEMCELVSKNANSRFLTSRVKYIEFLDELTKRFAREIAGRNGLARK